MGTDMVYYSVGWGAVGDGCVLGEVSFSDGRQYSFGAAERQEGSLVVEVVRDGRMLDFNLGMLDEVVVRAELGRRVVEVAGECVQVIPARVGAEDGFVVLNPLCVVDCLDESRSVFRKYDELGVFSNRIGEYRSVDELWIDPSRVPSGAHFFLIGRWRVVMVVSEAVKAAMESVGCEGAIFRRVS